MNPSHVDEYLAVDHEIWTLGEATLPGFERIPSDVNFTGANLSGTFIINANFCDAMLIGADFSRSNRINADFSGATMPDGTKNP